MLLLLLLLLMRSLCDGKKSTVGTRWERMQVLVCPFKVPVYGASDGPENVIADMVLAVRVEVVVAWVRGEMRVAHMAQQIRLQSWAIVHVGAAQKRSIIGCHAPSHTHHLVHEAMKIAPDAIVTIRILRIVRAVKHLHIRQPVLNHEGIDCG